MKKVNVQENQFKMRQRRSRYCAKHIKIILTKAIWNFRQEGEEEKEGKEDQHDR